MKRTLLYFLGLIVSLCCAEAQSPIDTKIAVNSAIDDKTFVLIISNENYKYEQPVPYALNDGNIFRLYCEKTLGIPEDNIKYQPDATLNDIQTQLWLLDKKMKAFEGEARAIVYYSGHGMPSEDTKDAYLLPIDGNSSLPKSGLSIAEMYKQLGNMPSKQTIVLLDACFSGARRDGQMLASSRGVALKVKQEPVSGNMVVFSAAQGNETAYPYKEKQHGLFTYYILEQLQEHGGCVSLGELSDYVIKQVSRTSIVKNEKSQTPSVTASSTNVDWRNWKFANRPATKFEKMEGDAPRVESTAKTSTSQNSGIILKRDITFEDVETLETSNVDFVSQPSVAVSDKAPTLRLDYADWYGPVKNGKPDGFGKMIFRKKHQIDSNDPDKNIAESGDSVEGSYTNGHLEQGTWNKSNGDSELLLIGL